MHSLETGTADAREATSMHPLWSEYVFATIFKFYYSYSNRYAFPEEPIMDGEMIDLTADERLFYFNPYSGELSLEFPRAERNCKGGILACVIHYIALCSILTIS